MDLKYKTFEEQRIRAEQILELLNELEKYLTAEDIETIFGDSRLMRARLSKMMDTNYPRNWFGFWDYKKRNDELVVWDTMLLHKFGIGSTGDYTNPYVRKNEYYKTFKILRESRQFSWNDWINMIARNNISQEQLELFTDPKNVTIGLNGVPTLIGYKIEPETSYGPSAVVNGKSVTIPYYSSRLVPDNGSVPTQPVATVPLNKKRICYNLTLAEQSKIEQANNFERMEGGKTRRKKNKTNSFSGRTYKWARKRPTLRRASSTRSRRLYLRSNT